MFRIRCDGTGWTCLPTSSRSVESRIKVASPSMLRARAWEKRARWEPGDSTATGCLESPVPTALLRLATSSRRNFPHLANTLPLDLLVCPPTTLALDCIHRTAPSTPASSALRRLAFETTRLGGPPKPSIGRQEPPPPNSWASCSGSCRLAAGARGAGRSEERRGGEEG